MSVLSHEEVRARVASQRTQAIRAENQAVAAKYKFVRPFACAAEDLIDWMSNPDHRLMFGLTPLDAALRGVGRGELCYVTGKAHSGKTQLILHMVAANPGMRFLYFTPDEVDSLVLAKLVAITEGLDVETLERRIGNQDQAAKNLVRRVANERFGNLAVIDSSLTLTEMMTALREAQDMWGEACDGVIVDYLDLIPGDVDYTGTKGKSTGLKRWAKVGDVPVVCIHQPKRGGARRGETIGMDDMNMGGETEGTFVLGVYRKRDSQYLDESEVWRHTDTVSVTISKNKRPPCKTGDFDFHLDPRTGRIRELRPDDYAVTGAPLRTVAEAEAARRLRLAQ